jgi:hypothetical protein
LFGSSEEILKRAIVEHESFRHDAYKERLAEVAEAAKDDLKQKTNVLVEDSPPWRGKNPDRERSQLNKEKQSKTQKWATHLAHYSDTRALAFGSKHEFYQATELLDSELLRTMPFEAPGRFTLIVPADAVRVFSAAGLLFAESRVGKLSSLPAQRIKQVVRENLVRF